MAFYTNFPVYPTEVLDTTDYPDQADDVDYVYDHLVNALRDEVIAVQAELGTVPKAGYADVKARLTAAESPSKIQDADGDTSWDTEETADKDEIQGKVGGVEFFRGHSDGIITLAKQSKARAYKNAAAQALTHNTLTKIILDAENYDAQNEFDSTTHSRFTAKKAGYYLVIGSVYYAVAVDQIQFRTLIYKNGSAVTDSIVRSSGIAGLFGRVSDIIFLAATDYLELWARQQTGVNQNANTGSNNTFLAIHKLS